MADPNFEEMGEEEIDAYYAERDREDVGDFDDSPGEYDESDPDDAGGYDSDWW